MKDVLYYEKNIEYPFPYLVDLKTANPLSRKNFDMSDYTSPIKTKQMSKFASIDWIMPELFWPFDEDGSEYKYLLPYYFNEKNFDFETDSVEFNDSEAAMSYPSTRMGVRFGNLEVLHDMTEREVRLSYDKLTTPPGLYIQGTDSQGVYKYSQNSDGIPFLSYDDEDLTLSNYLSTPREIGMYMVAPAGWLRNSFSTTKGYSGFSDDETAFKGQLSYIARVYHGDLLSLFVSDADQSILKPNAINVNRSSAFKQKWYEIPSIMVSDDSDIFDGGFLLSSAQLYVPGTNTPVMGRSKFTPFTDGVYTEDNHAQAVLDDADVFGVLSLQKYLWTRIQLLPMAISPWDVTGSYSRALLEDGIKYDIFDFLYIFNFVGFRASDYTEDVYNRNLEIVNRGLLFDNDPWFLESPVYAK